MMCKYKNSCLVFLICCISKLLSAQEFKVKAALDTVSLPGFYRIQVQPELTAYTKADLSDLRITDNNYKQVPYIIRQLYPVISSGSFINFPILKTTTDSISTTIEMACPMVPGNNHISLLIANNAVERYISISGSNDRHQWFIIEEHILLSSSAQDEKGSFVQSVYFPFSRYKYYKLNINNAHTDPLNIIKAGVYTSKSDTGTQRFTANPPVSFIQIDSSNGMSYITVHQNAAYHLDKVVLNIDGPKYYKRTANLYYLPEKGSKIHLGSFEIVTGHSPAISMNTLKAKSLLIEIENKNNPPLAVFAASTEQINRDLVAYLEKGKSYFIVAGNELLNAPQYDLLQFRDSIAMQLPSISYHDFQPTGITVPNKNRINMSYWLWPTIILFIFALGFLTYKLLADMRRSGI